jgi:hypothetical protein
VTLSWVYRWDSVILFFSTNFSHFFDNPIGQFLELKTISSVNSTEFSGKKLPHFQDHKIGKKNPG